MILSPSPDFRMHVTRRGILSYLLGLVVASVAPTAFWSAARWAVRLASCWRRRGIKEDTRTRKRSLLSDRIHALAAYSASSPNSPTNEPGSSSSVDAVTSCTISETRRRVLSGELSLRLVVKCFIQKAIEAHRRTNCLVDVLTPDEIEEQISRLDALLTAAWRHEGGTNDPSFQAMLLFGVPVSIKDNISLRGYDCTLALHSRCFVPAAADSAVVDRLRSHGAVIFCKTNIPVLMLSYESDSVLFGPVTNPWSARHSAGGSSGGEAALVALHGSAAGVGSDIGGSIRGPAAFCGVAALKPSMFRVANSGTHSVLPAQEGVGATIGPIGRCVKDVVIMTRALLPSPPSTAPHLIPLEISDGLVHNVPFRQDQYLEAKNRHRATLRVGYYSDDGFVKAAPACARAVHLAVDALRADGVECVPVSVAPYASRALTLFYQVLSADGTKTILKGLGDEDPIGPVFEALRFATKSPAMKFLTGLGVAYRLRSPFFGGMLRSMTERSVEDYYALVAQRNELRHSFARDMFCEKRLDAILCPGMMLPAVRLGGSAKISFAISYTMLFNVLDLPAVSVPVTTVDSKLDAWGDDYAPLGGREGPLHAIVQSEYDALEMHGLPVGVQLVTARFTEEKALAYAEILESAITMMRPYK
jgi:Asp-tRNA(Asn)/Glu-tRNA(Gln) amidotransferase A subunit family amidase